MNSWDRPSSYRYIKKCMMSKKTMIESASVVSSSGSINLGISVGRGLSWAAESLDCTLMASKQTFWRHLQICSTIGFPSRPRGTTLMSVRDS